jgi:hypothetical protein
LEQLLPLMQMPGVAFYSLQKGAGREQLAALSDRHQIIDLFEHLNDFDDTAAAVANMDVIIGCDTSVAHLAGALGVPTWVLLPAVPDWRWMLNRMYTPWYPTVKLFRQTTLGVWDDVVETVDRPWKGCSQARVRTRLRHALFTHPDCCVRDRVRGEPMRDV